MVCGRNNHCKCAILFPTEPKITSFDLAHRLSVFPEDDSFDIVLFQILSDFFKASRNILKYTDPVPFQYVFIQIIRIRLKVRTDCFIGTVFLRTACFLIGFDQPCISLVICGNRDPVGPVSGDRIRIAARDCVFRRCLSSLCVIASVEYAQQLPSIFSVAIPSPASTHSMLGVTLLLIPTFL